MKRFFKMLFHRHEWRPCRFVALTWAPGDPNYVQCKTCGKLEETK